MKALVLGLGLLAAVTAARADLTAEEQQVYQGLAPAAQKHYLATRDFVHTALRVAEGKADPLTLPNEPKDFDPTYVTPKEKAGIDKAFQLNITAMINDNSTA